MIVLSRLWLSREQRASVTRCDCMSVAWEFLVTGCLEFFLGNRNFSEPSSSSSYHALAAACCSPIGGRVDVLPPRGRRRGSHASGPRKTPRSVSPPSTAAGKQSSLGISWTRCTGRRASVPRVPRTRSHREYEIKHRRPSWEFRDVQTGLTGLFPLSRVRRNVAVSQRRPRVTCPPSEIPRFFGRSVGLN